MVLKALILIDVSTVDLVGQFAVVGAVDVAEAIAYVEDFGKIV